LQVVNINPTSTTPRYLKLAPGVTPTFVAVSPDGSTLYALGNDFNLYFIGIDPGSDSYNKITQLVLTGTDHLLHGMAVSGDGRRLYIAAPGTALYYAPGQTAKGWYDG